ncbi:MFS transporter [Streptomyces lavendulocolor]|uniref:MFS transporter n=1 Tax=Streptomyces lavendulocolor TaxID=67316 RepID=A0ABV2W5J7_9ACTN
MGGSTLANDGHTPAARGWSGAAPAQEQGPRAAPWAGFRTPRPASGPHGHDARPAAPPGPAGPHPAARSGAAGSAAQGRGPDTEPWDAVPAPGRRPASGRPPGATATPPGAEHHPAAQPGPALLRPARVRLVLCGLLLALLLAVAEQLVTTTALPAITSGLRVPDPPAGRAPDRTSWTVTAYLLAAAVTLPVHGRLGDLRGRKGLFQAALVIFLAGTALAGWARSLDQLIAFRAVQGVGAGGLLAGAQTLTAALVPDRRRGRFLGLVGAVVGLAMLAGPQLGALVTEHVSWRWCFWAALPPGLLALLLVGVALPRRAADAAAGPASAASGVPGAPDGPGSSVGSGSGSSVARDASVVPAPSVTSAPSVTTAVPATSGASAARRRPDVLGALLLAAASTFLLLLADWGGTQYAWSSRVVLGLACGAAGTLLLFVVVENYAVRPIVPPRLLRDPAFAVTGLVGTTAGVALLAAADGLPAWFRLTSGVDATEAALLVLPLAAGTVVASLLSGHLISRTGRHTVHPVLGGAVAVVGMWLLSRLEPDTPRLTHSVWQAVLGVGIGLVLPAVLLAVQNAAAPADLSTATGAHTHVRLLGGCLGAAALGALLAHRLDHALGDRLPAGTAATDLPGPWAVTPRLLETMPPALRDAYTEAYAETMPRTFLYLVPVLGLGLLLALFLKERPPVAGDTTAVPRPRGATPEPGAGVPVRGLVQHQDGTGVPRAALTLIDAEGQQAGRGASGDDGRYALSAPGTGAYVLIASAGGHQPQAVPVTVGDRPVEVDVVLGGAGRLAGTVHTADGTPVRDAAVTLTDVRGEVVASARTGRDGSYVLTSLVAGEYTLAATAPVFRPAALPVSVQAARETRQDVELAGGSVLRGTVRAPDGRPVEDARVTLLDTAGNVVDTLTTGPDGTFRFVDLPSGEYTVIAAGYPPVATVLQVAGDGRTERDLRLGHDD